MTEQSLLEMKIHERKNIQTNHPQIKEWIVRVVGGWIYHRQVFHKNTKKPDVLFETATFVPQPNKLEIYGV